MTKRNKSVLVLAQQYVHEDKMNEAIELAAQLIEEFLKEQNFFYLLEMNRFFRSLTSSDQLVPVIRQLAREGDLKAFKAKLVEGMFALPDPAQKINTLLTSLLPDSFIGQVLYTPRHFTVSLSRGSLGVVVDELQQMLKANPEVKIEKQLKNRFQQHPQLMKRLEEKMPALSLDSLSDKAEEVISNRRFHFFCCSSEGLRVLEKSKGKSVDKRM